MGKFFNVTGACDPQLHYMVDIQNRLEEIRCLVAQGAYFTMNRARQYGKTTTLTALGKYLMPDYYVVSLDFQWQMSNAKFQTENAFSIAFIKAFVFGIENSGMPVTDNMSKIMMEMKREASQNKEELELVEMFQMLSRLCAAADKPIVLMIDEVDSATNNQVFLDFLAQLRGYYIHRGVRPTFQSVILAGVYDVKNIKRKIRDEDEHKMNSPWNIATDFDVVMSFSREGIEGMLQDYEADHHTGMNVEEIAGLIYGYTAGYPFLVSRICKLLDEKVAVGGACQDLSAAWTRQGFLEAVRILLTEKNTLFESLFGKLYDYPELKQVIYSILFGGKRIIYNPYDPSIDIARMFGFIKNEAGNVMIANRIFEVQLYNFFLSENVAQNSEISTAASNERNQYIQNGRLDMELVLEKFVEHFDSIYGDQKEEFDEVEGRRRFLLYIRPIINGTGNYYIESETRNARRMDVVVDYLGERFIIELKIWRGNAYNERGEKQLSDYLEYFHLKKGYMLSYNFNKKKETGVRKLRFGDRILVEAVV